MGEQGQRRSPAQFGVWIAVIGLFIAVVLGWAMMGIGARRLSEAERIRTGAEARLMVAVEFAAGDAVSRAQEARLAINKNNWGEAQSRLSRANELVTLIEQVVPESKRGAVGQVRDRLSETQRLTGERSQDALASLDSLTTDLDGLREKKSE